MPREKALVTPSVLRWAREAQGLHVETVAEKLKRSVAEIEAWESGDDAPTLAQARNVAKLYRRPLAVFFLPDVPKSFQPPTLADFRRLPEGVPSEFSPELRLLLRLALLRQEWVRDELRAEGRPPLHWIGVAKSERDAASLANRIRRWLDGPLPTVQSLASNAEALRFWIDRVEERGAFVFQSGGPSSLAVESIEARGFALLDRYAPFVMLNGSDSETGRIFTLIHEIVHLWLGEPGISNLEPVKRPATPLQRIEQLCNSVAAEILVPTEGFAAAWQREATTNVHAVIDRLARIHKVSREVIARRALDTQIIDWNTYFSIRAQLTAEWRMRRERGREKEGGPNWYLMVPKRAGYALTRRALGAFAEGRITGTDLAELLNSKINRLADIANHAGAPWRGWGPAA